MYRLIINYFPRPLLIRLSYLFRYVAPWLYRGNKVQCNVCEKNFSKFLDYGHGDHFRENVLCPYCLSLERHRLIWFYLQNKTSFFQAPLKFLHMAPEQCFYGRFKKMKNLNYYTGDLFSPLAEYKFDLHQIPFPENQFDVVFCNHVLEHVEDDAQCMRELYRVLKPGGFAIMQVPIDYNREVTYEDKTITSPEAREKAFWQRDHVRLYAKDYDQKLANAGFKMDCSHLVFELPKEVVERHRFPVGEVLYVGKK